MKTPQSTHTSLLQRWSYLYLLVGAVLLIASNGRWIIPIATWLAPVFLLRFSRVQRAPIGLSIILAVHLVVYSIAWQGMIPLPPLGYYLVASGMGMIYFLPFLLDRYISPRVHGFTATLIFPLAFTSIEYINILLNPYATWGALGYSQYHHLTLIQLVSVTGLTGLTFLVAWFASTIHWIWQHNFQWSRIRLGSILYSSVFISVLLFGGLRFALPKSDVQTVRIGAITTSQILDAQMSACEDDGTCKQKISMQLMDDFLEQARYAVQTGAEIVFWQEGGIMLLEEDEAAIIEQGKIFARSQEIYLGMALLTVRPDFPKTLGKNKVIWIAPSGEIITEYLKARPVPGEPNVAGAREIAIFDTPYGRIASVICYDMDFPALIRQAGQADVDIMLVPANDWSTIRFMHTQMAIFRAVENGFSLIRSTGHGWSAASDYHGRVLATLDYVSTSERLMIADVPKQGVRTMYTILGDALAQFCLVALLIVLAWAIVQRQKA